MAAAQSTRPRALRPRSAWARAAGALILAAALAGCGTPASKPAASAPAASASAPAASASAAASAASATPVVALWPAITANSIPPLLAEAGGYFAARGLNVKLQYLSGSEKDVAALLSGRAQFAVVAGAAVVAAMAHGAKLKMVASFMNRPVFIAMAVPSIRTAAQLPGTTWAVTSLGSADDFDLQAMFSYLKVPQSSVHIVPAGSVPAQLAMVEAGRAQGIVVSLPNNIIAEEKAGMHQFLNFEQMGVKEQNLGIVTTDAFAQQHPRTVVRFIEACVQGMNRFAQDRAFGYQVMKQYFHYTDPRVLAASYQFERNLWPRELYPTAAGTQRDIGEVATRDPAAKSVTPQDVITRKFVNQVVAAGYVYTGAQAATTGSAKGAAAGGGTGQSG